VSAKSIEPLKIKSNKSAPRFGVYSARAEQRHKKQLFLSLRQWRQVLFRSYGFGLVNAPSTETTAMERK
jgi:hypothetical protein